jgi:hypothetical protein
MHAFKISRLPNEREVLQLKSGGKKNSGIYNSLSLKKYKFFKP